MKNISIENEHCFVGYYAFLFPEEYATITRPYNNLSLRHTTYTLYLKSMQSLKRTAHHSLLPS